MGSRTLALLALLWAAPAWGQNLPYLCGDHAHGHPAGCGQLPFASLFQYPPECAVGSAARGVVEGTDLWDCEAFLPMPSGSPSVGDCPKWSGSAWVFGPCSGGGGVPLVVIGTSYVYLGSQLLYYTGS